MRVLSSSVTSSARPQGRGRGAGARASRHVDAERAAGVLVHHVRDGHGRDHLDEVGRDAAVQPAQTLALHDLAERTAHRALRALRCFLWNNITKHFNICEIKHIHLVQPKTQVPYNVKLIKK